MTQGLPLGERKVETGMSDESIHLENYPETPDIRFRHFRGESDYAAIAAVLTASERADQIERDVSVNDISKSFSQYLTNCDPAKDMILAEATGEVIGYARGWWVDEPPLTRLYKHNGFLLPDWRWKGVGRAMLNWMENRLKAVAQTHLTSLEKYLQTNTSLFQKGAAILMEKSGYRPVRVFFEMLRPNLNEIPELLLPDGLAIRPVSADHYRAIWKTMDETSREEWGYAEPTEEAFQAWVAHPHFQPDLWQIAWDRGKNKVAGTVLTYINHDENLQYDRLRGYTEGIGVVPEWRRQGVARALISQSLKAQRAAGMLESALIADSASKYGVTRLYESCGFKIVNRDTVYRKKMA